MKTVDVFAVKEESSEGRANTDCGETSSCSGTCGEIRAAPLHTVLRQGEASLPSAHRWPLFLTIRQRLTLGLSKSQAAGNNPDVLLVPKFHRFYELLNSTFTLSPRCVNVLVNQSADCSCTWMPKCKCRVSVVGVECGSEVVELRLHILNICEKAVKAT